MVKKTKNSKKPIAWSIEHIISLIEKNGGPKDLDLSNQYLRYVDWSLEAVAHQLEIRGYNPGDQLPIWVTPYSARGARGLNLTDANLQGANLRYANLQGVVLVRANLDGTDLRDTCLREANLYHADIHDARLWRADLRHALLSEAKLHHSSLYRAEFEDTDFLDADLTQTSLYKVDCSKIIVRRKSLPKRLALESKKEHTEWILWDVPDLPPDEHERQINKHLEYAKDAYRGLKTSFSNSGMYQDASWAYFCERVIQKRMHMINQVMIYHGEEIKDKKFYPFLYLLLHLKHFFIWLMFWIEELTCGYGERPLRVIGFALVVILGFAPIYWLSGGIANKLGTPLNWWDFLIYSMSTFATVNLPRFDIYQSAEFLTSFQALLGISVLALLMFALGNRISRS